MADEGLKDLDAIVEEASKTLRTHTNFTTGWCLLLVRDTGIGMSDVVAAGSPNLSLHQAHYALGQVIEDQDQRLEEDEEGGLVH